MPLKIRTPLAIILVIFAGAIVFFGAKRSANEHQLREAILAELQPVTLKNCELQRFGSKNDGGYLMCENLIEPIDVAYSYGIGQNADWDCDISHRYRIPVHQYDCFDPARPTCDGGTFIFHNECIAGRADQRGPRVFDTLENQIRKNGDTGRRLIVKMDIEGAEWDVIAATPDEVLASIPQITLEMHGYKDPKIGEVLQKLKRTFYLVNVHFNNWSCTSSAAPLPAWAYQTHWVNKKIGTVDSTAPFPAAMSSLNAPDAPNRPDCQLTR
ncbi:MAG TPA: hypothetical protein VFA58_04800 [Chthoniobacterales bacterium]|nr:hypothetical protein [Chthoniobacterales bacterium]